MHWHGCYYNDSCPVVLVLMPSLIPVDNVLGAEFIGVTLSSMCEAILMAFLEKTRHKQVVRRDMSLFVSISFGRFRVYKQLKYVNAQVASLLVLESLQMAFLIHGCYIVGVTNFGDFVAYRVIPWSIEVQSLMGFLIAFVIQQFYAWRIHQLSIRKVYIPTLIAILSFLELVLAIVFFIPTARHPSRMEMKHKLPLGITVLSIQVACDLTITTSMAYYLLTGSQRTARQQTIAVTTTLALYFITSGSLMLVFSIPHLVTYILFSDTFIYGPFWFILTRIYVCAFMTILNSRKRFRTKLAEDVGNGVMITISKFTPELGPCDDSTGIMTNSGVGNRSTAAIPSQKDFGEVKTEYNPV
ncbi:hypothetical protein BC827DRAFT_384360 [Russula dissimulans]|nr:hypothetical protein BC827DRAFT_384360 [Russula dissimulans]